MASAALDGDSEPRGQIPEPGIRLPKIPQMPGGRRVREPEAPLRGSSRQCGPDVRRVEYVSAPRRVHWAHPEARYAHHTRSRIERRTATTLVDDDLSHPLLE